MTKTVRIENADGGTHHKIRIITQVQNSDGVWVDSTAPVTYLTHPTMLQAETLWKGKRLILEEYE